MKKFTGISIRRIRNAHDHNLIDLRMVDGLKTVEPEDNADDQPSLAMENSWTYEDWRPTVNEMVWPQWASMKPSEDQFRLLRQDILNSAQSIARRPYDPSGWSAKASALLSLGYPELACSDSYKAIIICDSVLAGVIKDEDPNADFVIGWDDQRKQAYYILLSALKMLHANADALRVSHQALRHYPQDEALLQIQKGFKASQKALLISLKGTKDISSRKRFVLSEMGQVNLCRYPWIPNDLLIRDKSLILKANLDMLKCSDFLEIKESNLGGAKTTSEQSFGIFAKKNIPKGEMVLKTKTPFGISKHQLTTQCYNCYSDLEPSSKIILPCCTNLRFCSTDCRDIAENYYHRIQCGKVFTAFTTELADKPYYSDSLEFSELIWLRALSISVQHGGHPLKTPLFARLMANYESDTPMPWNLGSSVVGPIKVLQSLGIDSFANPEYDGWALETIW
ncbi:hypothetical protein BP6252_00014 [Coleophoma cylindrospora]|uniref:MYND-type domain-containing protein n=1 Tax=Coleophoma cylindrospora TaxID=1849047 RepID=A0A3D8SNX1_9HELO|nr:hypothetical protein BP6252_00014 [Coleophoma cylindrospora]